MLPQTIFISLTVFLLVAGFVILILSPASSPIEARLRAYATSPDLADLPGRLDAPLLERLRRAILHVLGGRLGAVAPATMTAQAAILLERAGRPFGLTADVFVGAKLALAAVAAVAATAITAPAGLDMLAYLGITGASVWISYRAPDYWLRMRAEQRIDEIRLALPDALDLIIICVEAGLSFEAALARVIERLQGPLSDEIRRMLSDMSMGLRRREALQALAARCRTPEVTSFVAMIVQADQTGVAIGPVLRVQADALRVQRRQRAHEAGAKAPLKMLFPMVFCILPAIVAVILGPASLSLMDNFLGL